MKKLFYILSILLSLHISLDAKSAKNEVNHLALATLMIYDAKYDKAQEELNQVDKKSSKFDGAKFYTVSGVLSSKQDNHEGAIVNFHKAVDATKMKVFLAPKRTMKEKYLFSLASKIKKTAVVEFDADAVKEEKINKLYMHLSQEYYKLKDYKNTVISLDHAGIEGKSKAALYTLRAECYWKLKEHSNAIKAINIGMNTFKDDTTLLKQKFYYFADLELYQTAIQTAKIYMKKAGSGVNEYIALAQMLIAGGETNDAIRFLEETKLKFPKEPKVAMLLGHMYIKKDMKHTSADLFELSSYYDKKYLKDAVEMHRRAGNNLHALYLNTQNINKQEKLKQKIAIYIETGEFRKVVGLKKALDRYKMLDDDNLRYALAYSYYMSGDYVSAEKHLKKINDNELFNKATVIRKNIEKCQDDAMECI